jgi:subtilisin family serine protease
MLVLPADSAKLKGPCRDAACRRGVNEEDFASYVVGLANNAPHARSSVSSVLRCCGGRIVRYVEFGATSAVIVEVPELLSSEFAKRVRAGGLARYIEPNVQFQTSSEPNDPNWTIQWAPKKIQADYAWNTTWGDNRVLISVVDSGIDYSHPDLSPNYNGSGYDWDDNDSDPMDESEIYFVSGHGTFCAGIIAAKSNNGIGMAGMSQAQVMAERVDFNVDDCAMAIKHSVDVGARIISCSWGDYFDSNLLHDAIEYAYNKGVLIVAGAGNNNLANPFYPAAYHEVIGVSGTNRTDGKSSFSNYGDWIELAAPAENIYSTKPNSTYQYWNGTSFAGPHLVGAAALVWSHLPSLTRDQVRVQMRYTADDLGSSGFDNLYGYGRVNAKKAVETALPDHDLTILYLDFPERELEPNENVTIRVPVHNFGLSDAYNVSSRLLVNGALIGGTSLSHLRNGETIVVNYTWTPIQEGHYNLTCILDPVPEETIFVDNVRQAGAHVSIPRILRVPADYSTINSALVASNDGDTIAVSSGVYNENIKINKSVSLVGQGSATTIIQGLSSGASVIVVNVPFVTISRFTIRSGSNGVRIISTAAQNVTVMDNTIANCSQGIWADWLFGIMIAGNVIRNNGVGLWVATQFEFSTVMANNFTMNQYAFRDTSSCSSGTLICFNNFLDSSIRHIGSCSRQNIWDCGYPAGGNYWSDYAGTDIYRGMYQNVTGMDDIGDTPYNISGAQGTYRDRYPLMHPWTRPRNLRFEQRGWSVYIGAAWNASSGWRDRRGDIDENGIVNLFDTVLVTSAYGSKPGSPKWNPKADLDGDGAVSIIDVVMVTREYGSHATRLTGAYSWFSNGSSSSVFTMWQSIDLVNGLRNRTVRFSFYFYPNATAQTATAKIHYTTPVNGQWIIGTPVNGAVRQWSLASVTATIPLDAIGIQIWIEGQADFKAYVDSATLTVEG